MRALRVAVAALVLAGLVAPVRAGLLWEVETTGGEVVSSRGDDVAFNPASVIKVGTSWLALERLGPDHRYVTTFQTSGKLDRNRGLLSGDLVVLGGADPDFQLENAMWVARRLNRAGVREVSGDLVVEGTFWMGWEGGPFKRLPSRRERLLLAARRLRRAWNPTSWNAEIRKTWRDLARRRGWKLVPPPCVRFGGSIRLGGAVSHPVNLVVHRSNPLRVMLKRFDVYSNNDIERIASPLGGAPAVQAFLRRELGDDAGRIVLHTACGEGVNRMTPRLVVRMLVRFRAALGKMGLAPRDILPLPGCDPGPVPLMFPRLARGRLARCVVCKTGTLTTTGGGVAVLSGFLTTRPGRTIVFCVAAPGAGRHLRKWRRAEQRWLLRLIRREGGARPASCGAPFLLSDGLATVQPASRGMRR